MSNKTGSLTDSHQLKYKKALRQISKLIDNNKSLKQQLEQSKFKMQNQINSIGMKNQHLSNQHRKLNDEHQLIKKYFQELQETHSALRQEYHTAQKQIVYLNEIIAEQNLELKRLQNFRSGKGLSDLIKTYEENQAKYIREKKNFQQTIKKLKKQINENQRNMNREVDSKNQLENKYQFIKGEIQKYKQYNLNLIKKQQQFLKSLNSTSNSEIQLQIMKIINELKHNIEDFKQFNSKQYHRSQQHKSLEQLLKQQQLRIQRLLHQRQQLIKKINDLDPHNLEPICEENCNQLKKSYVEQIGSLQKQLIKVSQENRQIKSEYFTTNNVQKQKDTTIEMLQKQVNYYREFENQMIRYKETQLQKQREIYELRQQLNKYQQQSSLISTKNNIEFNQYEYQQKIKNMQQTIELLQMQYRQVKNENEQLSIENNKIQRKMYSSGYSQQQPQYQTMLYQKDRQINELNFIINEQRTKNSNLNNELYHLKSNCEQLHRENTEMNENYESMYHDHNAQTQKIYEFINENQKIKYENNILQAKVHRIGEQYNVLEQKYQKKNLELISLQSSNQKLEYDISLIKRELQSLKYYFNEIEQYISQQKQKPEYDWKVQRVHNAITDIIKKIKQINQQNFISQTQIFTSLTGKQASSQEYGQAYNHNNRNIHIHTQPQTYSNFFIK